MVKKKKPNERLDNDEDSSGKDVKIQLNQLVLDQKSNDSKTNKENSKDNKES